MRNSDILEVPVDHKVLDDECECTRLPQV